MAMLNNQMVDITIDNYIYIIVNGCYKPTYN